MVTSQPLTTVFKIALLFIFSSCGCINVGMAQNLSYVKGLHNSVPLGDQVSGTCIFVDNTGNTYVAGSFYETADFDPGPGKADLTSSQFSSDIFIAKYDATGLYQYAVRMGGNSEDFVYALVADLSGNVYVTGSFGGTADFDPGAGVAMLTSAGGQDIFIAKFDGSGNYLFAKAIGSLTDDYGRSITLDIGGFVSVTGSFTGNADFDPGVAVRNLTATGSEAIFVARFDGSGNYINALALGASGMSVAAGYGITADGSGNLVVTGYFEGTVDFDPGAGTANLTSAGLRDVFIAKYDVSGNYVFARGMGGIAEDLGDKVAVDAAGNLYVAGYFRGTADFDPDGGVVNLSSAGSEDVFIAKYDPSGAYLYAIRMGGNGIDFTTGLDLDASGNVFISGYFEGSADFDPGTGSTFLTSAGDEDGFVATYDNSGNYVFARSLGGSFKDNCNSIAVDGLGNIYTTGSFSGTADFDPGTGISALTIDSYKPNAFICTFTNAGNFTRVLQLGMYSYTPLTDFSISVVVDASGNTYYTGRFFGTVDFDPGAGIFNLTGVGSTIFIARYDPMGNFVYARAMGGTGSGVAYALALDLSSNIYITGEFSGSIDFDPGAQSADLTSSDIADIFIAKYDAAGNLIYAKAFGGSSGDNEAAFGIAVDGAGNAYITGSFYGTADFDPSSGLANLVTAGQYDVFIAKFDAFGNYVFAKALGGSELDEAHGIKLDLSGNIYVTGYFVGISDFDPGPGTANLTSAGSGTAPGVFFAKYDASGNYSYAKAIGTLSQDAAFAYSIAVDAGGSVYITGDFRDIVDFDPGPGTANLVSAGDTDVFLAKYDAAGNYVYALAIQNSLNAASFSVAIDAAGNAYITGYFVGSTDFDPGTGLALLTTDGDQDMFIAKYDVSGNFLFARAGGGIGGGGGGYGVALDGTGNIYVTGLFVYTANFDQENGSANSTINAPNSSDIFFAKYDNATVLPVQLTSFTAMPINNGASVLVNWSTASQSNHAYFDVERSKNGVQFETIGRKQGCSSCPGKQHYELKDNTPLDGTSYYRLRQVDLDNKFEYSAIAEVNRKPSTNIIVQAFPTITNGPVEIRINNAIDKQQITLQLVNGAGSLVREKKLSLIAGNNTLDYSLNNQVRGLYFIRVIDSRNNTLSITTIIKK